MPSTSIDAILWDFGGVLTTSPFEAFNRYETERGLPRDLIRTINATNPEENAWARLESSLIDLEAFDEAFAAEARAAGHHVPGRDVIALLSGELRPRMVSALERCKEYFRVGCITNNVKSGQEPAPAPATKRAERIAAVMELFDVVVESSIEGVRKPDPRIYRIACERLGVGPARTVFLDDLGINLKPARALGMHTIKVLDEEQALRALSEVTGLELS